MVGTMVGATVKVSFVAVMGVVIVGGMVALPLRTFIMLRRRGTESCYGSALRLDLCLSLQKEYNSLLLCCSSARFSFDPKSRCLDVRWESTRSIPVQSSMRSRRRKARKEMTGAGSLGPIQRLVSL